MSNIYQITTGQGHRYLINEKSQIIRTDMVVYGSEGWKFHSLVDRYERKVNIENVNGNCRFKNGKGKYWLVDIDHGTFRLWSDRIVSVDRLTRKEFVDRLQRREQTYYRYACR